MDLELKGKVIIVTGGSKGIGEAIVLGIVKEGGIPVIVNRPGKEGEILQENFNKEGVKCLYIPAELSTDEVCKDIIDKTVSRFGKIDGLVNNAGKNDGVGLKTGVQQLLWNLLKIIYYIIILWLITLFRI